MDVSSADHSVLINVKNGLNPRRTCALDNFDDGGLDFHRRALVIVDAHCHDRILLYLVLLE